jgi:hypothetical protein
MFHIHKWEYFNETQKNTFLGETYTSEIPCLRRCTKCGKIQEIDYSLGWITIQDQGAIEIFSRNYGAPGWSRFTYRIFNLKHAIVEGALYAPSEEYARKYLAEHGEILKLEGEPNES